MMASIAARLCWERSSPAHLRLRKSRGHVAALGHTPENFPHFVGDSLLQQLRPVVGVSRERLLTGQVWWELTTFSSPPAAQQRQRAWDLGSRQC